MIIDCHEHLGRGVLLNDVFQIDSTVERLEYLMNKAGVDKALIFPVTYKDYRKPNEEIARVVSENKRFMGLARVIPQAPDAPRAGGIRPSRNWVFWGLKVHPMDGFPTREIMDKVRELKVPVLAHSGMGLAPITFEGIIQSYPDVTIILAHLGFDLNWSNMFSYPLQAFYLARKYKKRLSRYRCGQLGAVYIRAGSAGGGRGQAALWHRRALVLPLDHDGLHQ